MTLQDAGLRQLKSLIDGATLSVTGTSTDTVTVSVTTTDTQLTASAQLFVDQFNKLREKLDTLTFFNETDNTTGILFGSNETLRVENEISQLLSARFGGVGSIQSLEELGFSFDNEGKLSLNKAKLQDKFAEDPEAVE